MGGASGLHCTHCGHEVAETMHTRASYRVGYYTLHTGDVEPMTIQRADEEAVTVLKLLTRRDVVTCAECYRQLHVRLEREALFCPEQGGTVEPVGGK